MRRGGAWPPLLCGVVGGGARSLRAVVEEVVAFFGAAAIARLSRRR